MWRLVHILLWLLGDVGFASPAIRAYRAERRSTQQRLRVVWKCAISGTARDLHLGMPPPDRGHPRSRPPASVTELT